MDEERKTQVKRCIHKCEEGLGKLSKKLQKLRTYSEPEGLRQKALAELQRAWYPLRASTLAKLKEIVDDVKDGLQLAIQVLHLNVTVAARKDLAQLATDTKDISARTVAIESGIGQLSSQNDSLSRDVNQLLSTRQMDQFKNVVARLSPPDPYTNHASARQRFEPQTGAWLLESEQYKKWKLGATRHLWLSGKAGCGKTVLCSTVIEDIAAYCESKSKVAHAMFYFSFSDKRKQSYDDLLLSLVAQLGRDEPSLSMLLQASGNSQSGSLASDVLEKICIACVASYDEIFVLLDALDECPVNEDIRQDVLSLLERLSSRAPNLKIFATSRQLEDVADTFEVLGAASIGAEDSYVDVDIARFLSTQLLNDRRLSRLGDGIKQLIKETVSQKADGMYVIGREDFTHFKAYPCST